MFMDSSLGEERKGRSNNAYMYKYTQLVHIHKFYILAANTSTYLHHQFTLHYELVCIL